MSFKTKKRRQAVDPSETGLPPVCPSRLTKMSLREKVLTMPSFNLPYLSVELGRLNVAALVDSGATKNLITPRIHNLIKRWITKETKEGQGVRIDTAIEHQQLTTNHRVFVKMKVDGYSWVCPFYVVKDLHVDVVLGVEFIVATGLVSNIREQYVTFRFNTSRKVPLLPFFNHKYVPASIPELWDELKALTANTMTSGPNLSHLNPEQASWASKILAKYPKVLTKELGKTTLIEYDIPMTDNIPVRSGPFSFGPPKMDITRGLVRELENDDVVELSTSPYASPAFPVPKPNNKPV